MEYIFKAPEFAYLPHIIAVAAVAVAAILITVILCRRYVAAEFSAIDRMLDKILAKNADIKFTTSKDSRISKLTHKASRIAGMYVTDAAAATEEKEIIQGFISDMLHQMKTPLAGMSMYLTLLLEGNVTESEAREFLLRISAATGKLSWMMDSLVKMSRLEIGTIQLSPAKESVRQTVSESIGGVAAIAADKDINITVGEFEDAAVICEKKWTREALNNILENAVKYSPRGGAVDVSVETLALYTKVAVTNDGPGIPAAEYNLIFKRFYRGSNVKDAEGAGLGLYLASVIAEKQGGYIMVESKPNEKTTFSLFLMNGNG